MSSIILSGSLGERFKLFNETVKNTCNEKKSLHDVGDFQPQTDIDNLLKIDVANHFKDVNFILETLKSDDSLLKSRALRCLWLFNGTDSPEVSRVCYMKDNIFPYISNNTKCKIVHNLSIHLKNDKYSEEYFEYFIATESYQFATKFLPSCSVTFIAKAFNEKNIELSETQLLKITEKDLNLSYEFFKNKDRRRIINREFLKVARLMAAIDTGRFIDWYESTLFPEEIFIKLGGRVSSKILKNHKVRIINSITKYAEILKRQAIVDSLNREEVKAVLKQLLPKKSEDIWQDSTLFVAYTKKMTKDEQFDMFQDLFKSLYDPEIPKNASFLGNYWRNILPLGTSQKFALNNLANKVPWYNDEKKIYMWYTFVDFEIAFPRLKELVKAEPKAPERMNILVVMVDSYCRRNKPEELLQLLQYYFKFHINEQCRYEFIIKLIYVTVPYKYDDDAWTIINEIFHSFDVYSCEHADYTKRKCLNEIIRRHVSKDTKVPDEVLNRFIDAPQYIVHDTKTTNIEFEDKFIMIVIDAMIQKFEKIDYEKHESDKADILYQLVELVRNWNVKNVKNVKSLSAYPSVIEFIIKRQQFPTYSMQLYFETDKTFVRQMIDVLLLNDASGDVLLYCLKHKHSLLVDPTEKILEAITNSWNLHTKFYKRLRTYFANDVGKFWTDHYKEKIKDPEIKSRYLQNATFALSILLEKEKYLEVMDPYKPVEAKIKWSDIEKNILERSKLVAKYSHLVRPLLSPETVLAFAKGDHLQYVLSSLISLCYQYTLTRTKEVVMILINSPVSVQKHGIRLLLILFSGPETTEMIMDIWSKSKNASIRFVILENLVRFLVKVRQSETRERFWHCLKAAISQLSGESDNKLLEHLVENAGKIHEENFSDYCQCCWEMLIKHGDQNYLTQFLKEMYRKQTKLNSVFCENLLKDYIEKNIATEAVFNKENGMTVYDNEIVKMIIKHLLYVETDSVQTERICHIYELLLKHLKTIWNKKQKNASKAQKYFTIFLKTTLMESFNIYSEYINSKRLLQHILADMSTFLPISEGFNLITVTKLVCLHHEIFDHLRLVKVEYNEELKPAYLKSISDGWQAFGRRSGELLNEMIENYFYQISILFRKAFEEFTNNYMHYRCFNRKITENFVLLNIAKGFISHENQTNSILAGLQIVPAKVNDDLSKTLHSDIISTLKNIKKAEIIFFLNAQLNEDDVI